MSALHPPAIVFEGRHWASEEVAGIAAGWRYRIREEGRIFEGPMAMVMANRPEAVALFFALSSLPVPLILLPPEPRAWRSSPPLPAGTPLFLLPRFRDLAASGERAGLRVTVLPEVVPRGAGESLPFLSCPGVVIFTSGSTGIPKPVYRSTATVLTGTFAIIRAFDLAQGSGVVGVLPLAQGSGLLFCLLAATVLKGQLGLLDRFDHRRVLALFASGEYQFWGGAPVMAEILARCPLPKPQPAPPVCVMFGGKVAAAIFPIFQERFGTPLRCYYAATETGPIAMDTSPAAGVRPETVGQPFPEVKVRIGDDPREPFPSGNTGRIWVKSPWCMEGYGFPPHLEPREELDGWWPTSDLGCLDETGYLTLIGRMDDCVKLSSGHLVNLTDIAGILASFPGVTGVAVVPLDTHRALAIGALAESEVLSPMELRRHLARLLPPWSRPRVVEVTRELPRLAGGKPDRRACIEVLERTLPRKGAS